MPVTEEPRHKVVFTNPYVRVIDASHCPSAISPCFTLTTSTTCQLSSRVERFAPQVVPGATSRHDARIGRAWFAKAAYTHQIANIGTTPLRFIDAEILALERQSPRVLRVAQFQPGEDDRRERHRARRRVSLAAHDALARHVHVRAAAARGGLRGTWLRAFPAPRAASVARCRRAHGVQNDRATGRIEAVIVEWK